MFSCFSSCTKDRDDQHLCSTRAQNGRKSNRDLKLLNSTGAFLGLETNLEDFDLFSQQCLGLSQVLLVDALHCHLPAVFLQGHVTCKFILVSAQNKAAQDMWYGGLAVFGQHTYSQHVSANSTLSTKK